MSAHASRTRTVAAWAVHTYTASGVVLAFVALQAVNAHRFTDAFLWLCLAFAIDCSDGTLARAVDVKRVVPWFDGTLLDNIVDYLTYVLVPIALLYEADLFAGPPLLVAAIPLLASTYGFCRTDAKTSDHYFRGFPSYWNVVAFYAWRLSLSPEATTIWVVLLSVLVFVPVKFLYPSRSPHLRGLTIGLGLVWALILLVVLVTEPAAAVPVVWASLVYPAYYVALSLWLQVRNRTATPHTTA